MVRYQPNARQDFAARREQLWSTIFDYRYMAALELATDEGREDARAAAILRQLIAAAAAAAPAAPPNGSPRDRFGAVVAAIGQRLHGTGGMRSAPGAPRSGSPDTIG